MFVVYLHIWQKFVRIWVAECSRVVNFVYIMTPKIIFKYSPVYDQNWKEWIKIYKRKTGKYPTTNQILSYIKKVEKLWRKDEKKILEELSNVTGLKWRSEFIYCYVVGRCIPFSDPLTLPVYDKYPDDFIDTLIHELIHQLFIQKGNKKKTEKAWNYIDRKYKEESHKTRIHIPLHAIHSHMYLKSFNEKRLNRDIRLISHLPDYKKAWEIVQKEGYQKIIKEFTKRVK